MKDLKSFFELYHLRPFITGTSISWSSYLMGSNFHTNNKYWLSFLLTLLQSSEKGHLDDSFYLLPTLNIQINDVDFINY